MKITKIIPMALQSFRVNPFHTFLSCLGIIIGVGALFSILSLADGMEELARVKVAERTNLKSFSIAAKTTELVDGLRITKENIASFNLEHAQALSNKLKDSKVQMTNNVNTYLKVPDDTIKTGSAILGLRNTDESVFGDYQFSHGANFSQEDIDQGKAVIVITRSIAEKLFPNLEQEAIVGQQITMLDKPLSIAGILESTSDAPQQTVAAMRAAVPITLFTNAELEKFRPRINVAVQTIENYDSEKARIMEYLDESFEEGSNAFTIASYAGIMKDVQDGMLLFKVIMGMIVGISVIVGGIGIMNVLLMSIKERTKEIGVRKAIGASATSIKWQFLLEALFLSFIGSGLGVVLGIGFLTLAMAILRRIPQSGDMPFDWAFSWGTTLVITVVAILIGLVFGTYPAAKAAKLDPIDAIRHE